MVIESGTKCRSHKVDLLIPAGTDSLVVLKIIEMHETWNLRKNKLDYNLLSSYTQTCNFSMKVFQN